MAEPQVVQDQTSAVQAQAALVEQYEIDEAPSPAANAVVPAPEDGTPAPTSSAPESDSRPRGPDGRFLPATKHSPRMKRMANELGLDDDEIEAKSPEQLEDVVYYLTKQALAAARENSIHRTVDQALDRNGKEAEAEPPLQDQPLLSDADLDLGIADEADYNPEIIKAIKKAASSRDKRIADLEKRINVLLEREQVRANETMAEQIDRHFEKHAATLGHGRGRDMAPDSPDYLRRVAVLGVVQRDKSKSPLSAKIDRAVEALYGVPAKSAADAEPRADQEKRAKEWANGSLAKPTQRASEDEPAGPRKAERSIRKTLQDFGQVTGGNATRDDFLE